MPMEHMEDPPVGASIGQLGHHIGLHVDVNLQGKTIGGLYCEAEQWVPGVIIGQGALGNSLTIKLDMPIGGGQRGGFLHRQSRGEDLIAIDDAARVRPRTLANVQPSGVPNEIVELGAWVGIGI